jgi:hypothetical protein
MNLMQTTEESLWRALQGIRDIAEVKKMHVQAVADGNQLRKRLTMKRWRGLIEEQTQRIMTPEDAIAIFPYVPKTFNPLHREYLDKWEECSQGLLKVAVTLEDYRHIYETAPLSKPSRKQALKGWTAISKAEVEEAGDSLEKLRLAHDRCPSMGWVKHSSGLKIRRLEKALVQKAKAGAKTKQRPKI